MIRHKKKMIQTKLHRIGTYDVCKMSLCCFDDKRYILNNGIFSLVSWECKKLIKSMKSIKSIKLEELTELVELVEFIKPSKLIKLSKFNKKLCLWICFYF